MNKLHSPYGIAIILGTTMLMAACAAPMATPTPTAALPTATPIMVEATPTPEPSPQPAGWELIDDGEGGPAPRFDHVLVYDPQGDRLFLFGGQGEEIFADTWIYEIESEGWREIDGEGPSARFGMAAAYDPLGQRIMIFGGQSGGNFFNEVWAFDLSSETWSQLTTNGGPPHPRYGTSAIVDEARNRLIISHGFTDSGRFDDTWSLDLSTLTWSDITPPGTRPLKRCLLETAYDPAGDRMLLFGGCSSGFGPCPQGDLWAFDLDSHTWTELTPDVSPEPVSNPALVFDQTRNEALLFGGKSSEGAIADLWALDAASASWSRLDFSGPAPRRSHDAALDSQGRLWVFGGIAQEPNNELWRLTLAG